MNNLKDKPSLIILQDHHHYNKRSTTIANFPTKGVDKQILVLNTDKHNHVRIVTPDAIIELRTMKKDKEASTSIRVMSRLRNDKTRETLRLSSFDDMGETNIEVEGERREEWWEMWLKEES